MQIATLAFSFLAIVIGMLFLIAHPFICIAECALTSSYSNSKKTLWIILSLVFGCIGSLAYAIFGTESARLRRHSLQLFALGIFSFAASFGCSMLSPSSDESPDVQLADTAGDGGDSFGASDSIDPSELLAMDSESAEKFEYDSDVEDKWTAQDQPHPESSWSVEDNLDEMAMVLFTSTAVTEPSTKTDALGTADENWVAAAETPTQTNQMEPVESTSQIESSESVATQESPFGNGTAIEFTDLAKELAEVGSVEEFSSPADQSESGEPEPTSQETAAEAEESVFEQIAQELNVSAVDDGEAPTPQKSVSTELPATPAKPNSGDWHTVNRYLTEGISPALPPRSTNAVRNRYTGS